MIVVIIAGGSGTRLWPLSTPDFPKHLLNINGENKSLLQKTYDRAKKLSNDIYILTEVSHAHHVQEQLPDLTEEKFIIEPARRGTASCIVAALAKLKDENRVQEPIAFLVADHYIRDVEGFSSSFRLAAQTSEKYKKIVLVGIEPDYPATGFGYIQKDTLLDQTNFAYNVQAFKEKPDYATAKRYVASGNYLWNSGYFVGSVNTFLKAMEDFSPDLKKEYDDLVASDDNYDQVYLGFENISIDYALIEKVDNLLVIPASFDWMDLGSFVDLHKAADNDENGNHAYGNVELEDVENSFVKNYEDKPVAVIGLDNVAVINTKDGILVTRKDLSQKVGEISKKINQKGR